MKESSNTMEVLKEAIPRPSNVIDKNAQSALLENDVQKLATKKKFCNTVFAARMRSRKNGEKLKQLDSKEVLSTCKPVSVDVTRLSSEDVPKIVSTIEHRHRKKKRFQWKLGMPKKRKKMVKKDVKENQVSKKRISQHNNVNMKSNGENTTLKVEEKVVNHEKTKEGKLESLAEKDDKQKRKSLRLATPMSLFDEKPDAEAKSELGLIPEEKFSCRRTEPFIGKLNTKEARIQNVEKILREEAEPIAQNSNEIVNENTNEPFKKDEVTNVSVRNEQVSEANEINNSKKRNEYKKILENEKNTEKADNSERDTSKENRNKDNSKSKGKSRSDRTSTSKITEENIVNQDSKKSSKNVIETKEHVKEEDTSCSRTKPFTRKTFRKPPSGVPERPTEIHCSTTGTKMDTEDMNIKSDLEPTDVNLKSDSKSINLNSETSHPTKSINADLETSKNSKTDVDSSLKMDVSSKNIDAELNSTTKNIDVQLDLPNDTNCIKSKLDSPSKIKVNTKSDSSIKETNTNLDSSSNFESMKDLNPNDINLKTVSNSDNDDKKEIWSCRRTEPYLSKEYPNCSRTLPFVRSTNKKKPSEIPETSTSLLNDQNSRPTVISNNVSSSEAEEVFEGLKQNTDANIPVNQENDMVNSVTDTTDISVTSNKSDTPIQNGEWKFRRKRQRTLSDVDTQVVEEKQVNKKIKVKSSLDCKKVVENETISSPGKTICSFLSLNCTKHVHHHTQNVDCHTSLKNKQKPYVLLTKLEKTEDPLVMEYLKNIDSTFTNKSDVISPLQVHFDNNDLMPNLGSKSSKIPHANEEEYKAKDDLSYHSAPTTSSETKSIDDTTNTMKIEHENNRQTEIESSNNNSAVETRSRMRRRTSSEISTDSFNFIRRKRRKGPVNYVENFSDSDTTVESFSMSLRTLPQSRGPTLRNRSMRKRMFTNDTDENDMEVEEFSYVALRNGTQSSTVDDSNVDSVKSKSLRTTSFSQATFDAPEENLRFRSKSVIEKKIQDKQKICTRSKTPSIGLTKNRDNRVTQMLDEVNKQLESHDSRTDKEVEGITLDCIRSRLRNRSSSDGRHKTLSFSEQETEFNNACPEDQQPHASGLKVLTRSVDESSEQSFCTPKKTNVDENIITSGRESRASLTEKSSSSLKKTLETSPRTEKSSLQIIKTPDAPLNSTERVKNSLLMKFSRLNPNSELTSSIITPVLKIIKRNLKVQLIKLEAVCSNFEDYSSSEIEVLTSKYIDLLMNSNFTCDTWRKPINYHRPKDLAEKHVEEIDNSDCVSDAETQEEVEEVVPVEESENPTVVPSAEPLLEENTEVEKLKERTPTKSGQNQLPLTTSGNTLEPHEKTFLGVINASEDPAAVSNNENEKEAFTTNVELNEEEIRHKDQERVAANEGMSTDHEQILMVNGRKMFKCSSCNKIFVDESLLTEHIQRDHQPRKKLPKKLSKKAKRKLRCKNLDNLQCTICSVWFETKELLFEHIMTHNEQELQEAYKNAKAQMREGRFEFNISDSDEQDQNASQKPGEGSKEDTGTNIRSSTEGEEVVTDDSHSQRATVIQTTNSSGEQQQIADPSVSETMAIIERVPASTPSSTTQINICSCHAHETSNQDLQIEVVLLCKTCNVIFRRRKCFEVHYRTSMECRRSRSNEVTKVPKLFCSGCLCVLNSLLDMRTHLEMHANMNRQGTVTFICNICKVAFFGVGGIFYSHWFNHTKAPNFLASRFSFPKLSVVSILEDSNVSMTTSKSQEGFFYIAEHVCRKCRLPFSSEPELQKHKTQICQTPMPPIPRLEASEQNRLQMIKLICDLCKKYYVNKESFDRHCHERNHLKTPITKFSRVSVSSNEQAFVCSLCRNVCKSLDDVKEHFKLIHSPIMELYTCKTCNVMPSNDVTNYTYDKFERHCRMVHKSEYITCLVYFVTARYVCSVCRFGFGTEKSLKEHQVIHENRRGPSSPTKNVPPPVPIEPTVSAAPIVPPISTVPAETPTSMVTVQSPAPIVRGQTPAPIIPGTSTVPGLQTLWVAEQYVATDANRQTHPVYVQYGPHVNGNVETQMPVASNTVPANPQNQPVHMPDLSPVNVVQNNVTMGGSNVFHSTNINTFSTNTILRNMLHQRAFEVQQQLQAQQNSTSNSTVETILIDSRSNSPTSSTSTTTTTTNNKIATSNAPTNRKSYMTMVNPDFESLLGTNTNARASENDNTNQQFNKETSNSSTIDSLTPQPFEVVLVTDDLSENSNSEETTTKETTVVPEKTPSEKSDSTSNEQQQTTERKESTCTKSFLRVRSVAELQRIKIHSCSVCGLSFDTLQAFDQHSQQHKSVSPQTSNEVGRSTPVQMISPMVAQNKETASNLQNMLQLRQKMALLSPNGNESLSSDLNRNSPSAFPNQHQNLRQNQQQRQQPWTTTCNSTKNITSPNVNYSYDLNRQQQQTNFHQQPVNLNSVINVVGGGNSLTRGPPPPYPCTSNSLTPGRPSAIQLPERNNAGNNIPTTKRPSGAATRIPQQSLPSFEEITDHRQGVSPLVNFMMNVQVPYHRNSFDNMERNNSPINSRMLPNVTQSQQKTYSRRVGDLSYSNDISTSQSIPAIYNCKVQNCSFRSENLATARAHEKNHLLAIQQTSKDRINQAQNVHKQQQRLPVKHVAVNQMPERTRHAVPNSRMPIVCRECNLNFVSKQDLMQHMSLVHAVPPTKKPNQVCCYVCDYCETPLIFDTEDLLRTHMDISHNHICEVCKQRYPSNDGLVTHMLVHGRST